VKTFFRFLPPLFPTYAGRCSELCGEYHSEMLFTVVVVSQKDYDAHIAQLRARGQVGQLGPDLDRAAVGNGSTG
jgi:cytochrome c oxidase subunit II